MAAVPQQQPEQIQATILGVEMNPSGFSDVITDQGKFSSKYPEPIAEAQAAIGQIATIVFQTSQRQHEGRWYTNRYLKKVIPLQGQPQPMAMQPQQPVMQAQPQQAMPQAAPEQSLRGTRDADMEIMRQTAAKCAVWTIVVMPTDQRTFQNQILIAEAWLRYFIGGRAAVESIGQPQPTQEQQMAAMGGTPSDDIPF